jgi:hypothetical protein
MFEVGKVRLRKSRSSIAYAFLQVGQGLGTNQRKDRKRLVGKVPKNDLRNRKFEFFLQASDSLKTFTVLLVIEQLSHAIVYRELI